MLDIILYVLLALAAAIAVFVAVASRRPDSFAIARTRRIAARPEALWPLIADLRRMNTWNPYALRATGGDASYSEPSGGKGAWHAFADKKSGTGRIEIVDLAEPRKVELRLVMTKPMTVDNRVTFTLEPQATGTDVTWAMHGPQTLFGKCFGMLVDCERMMTRDFDEGLVNLQAIAERKAAA